MTRIVALVVGLGGSLALPAVGWAQAPFGHACVAQYGVRFCPTTTLAERIPSWDGVPIDVDVTLPPAGNGPFPTIVMLHGLGADKTDFESTSPDGDSSVTFQYNNVFYAQRGYLVVNYSARGWGDSCGTPTSRTPDCETGWIRLADQRYEVRDAQYLLGLLVDAGLADPEALGATGVSYGGGTSVQLAALRTRTRLPNGRFVRWRSPAGRPLRIAAAYPRWPWSDLAASLVPNGRFRDDRPGSIFATGRPIGVEKLSYTAGLLLLAEVDGFLPPPGRDPGADLQDWKTVLDAGEPYRGPVVRIERQLEAFHSGARLLRARRAAPMLLLSGFTDDLFPASQALRVYLLQRGRRAPVLQLGDVGHLRAQNKLDEYEPFAAQGAQFFDAYLRGIGRPPAPGSVTAFTQTCPSTAPSGGPYTASSWRTLATGTFALDGASPQTVTADGGNPLEAVGTDPIEGEICARFPAVDAPGTAVYTRPSPGVLLVGPPTLRARVETDGPFGQLVGRLWDVDPTGQQALVARGVYRLRPNERGRIVFQLEGNAYQFPPGHVVRLELVGSSSPTYRKSNGTFTVTVRDATLTLPTRAGSPSGAFVE